MLPWEVLSPIRLIFVNQFYWPDRAPTAVLLDQVTRHAASEGHDVTVVCGDSGYVKAESGDAPPVRIIRVPGVGFSRNPLVRLLSWGSFFILAWWKLARLGRCDVLVTMTTPPGLSLPGAMLRRWLGARLWVWEMDVYPDVVFTTGGLSAHSLPGRLLQKIFTWSRLRADGIVALGECMKRRLERSGIPPDRIRVAQNWADDGGPLPLAPPDPDLRLLYSGNLGMAHDVDTIRAAMESLPASAGIRFVFAGGGALRRDLESYCAAKTLPNVEFRDYGNSVQFAANLAESHIGLVTLREGCEGTVVPSKVYSLLCSGRPILFIGPESATPARLIAEHACGWHFPPGDHAGIVKLLTDLRANAEPLLRAGANARKAYETQFTREIGTRRVLAALVEQPC